MPRQELARSFRPLLEGLEERVALSVVSAGLQGGTLVMQCNNSPSRAGVVRSGPYVFAADSTNGFSKRFLASQVRSVRFLGGQSHDCFHNDVPGLPSLAYGRGGSDSLRGNSNVDRFFGGSGVDYLNGMAGNDILQGEGDPDYIYGMAGKDQLFGGDGNDWLYGGTQNDILRGGDDNDFLFGQSGDDDLYGDEGDDWLEAGTADETASGGDGTDWNAHIWVYGGTHIDDVRQPFGSTTCSFLSTLAGVAAHGQIPGGLGGASATQLAADRIRYLGNFNYAVRMFDGASWSEQTIFFNGSVSNIEPLFRTEGESWTILMERAYLQLHPGDYRSPENAIAALTGAVAVQVETDQATDSLVDEVAAALAAGRTVVAVTPTSRDAFYTGPDLQLNHAYTVLGVNTDAFGSPVSVNLRDPAGIYLSLTVREFMDGYVAVYL